MAAAGPNELLVCSCGAVFPDRRYRPLNCDVAIVLFHSRGAPKHQVYEIKLDRVYAWDRMGRKGQRCAMLAKGARNSCLVIFADGGRAVTSWRALRRVK